MLTDVARELDHAWSVAESEAEETAARIERLKSVLSDAYLQIEYLHEKFQETGSGNAILVRINDVLER